MKLCKKMVYYVAAAGRRYYYGHATGDVLTAHILLSEARQSVPGEEWGIVAYAA